MTHRSALTFWAMLAATSAHAEPRLLTLAPGEQAVRHGITYRAAEATRALVSLSSEFVSVAVVEGRLSSGRSVARAGQVLVTPIERANTQVFRFDASALDRTLAPDERTAVGSQLAQTAGRQRRLRWLGLLEPVGINASAPAPVPVEAMRRTYLSDQAVVDIRARAGGDIARRRVLTAEAFALALGSGDGATLAALIDPKPFTNVTLDPEAWRAARRAFADRIVGDAALVRAAQESRVVADASGYRLEGTTPLHLTLVDRDRASFVAALEPVS